MKYGQLLFELFFLLALSAALLLMGVNYYIVMFIAIFIIINFELDRKGSLDGLGISKKRIWPAIRIQMPFTMVGTIGLLAYAGVNGFAFTVPGSNFVVYWIISVPLQEFLFRGYIQRIFREFVSRTWTVSCASIIFSLSHYFADTSHFLILMATTLGAGFAWGYPYEKERNLLGPIFSHLVLGTLIFLILPANGI